MSNENNYAFIDSQNLNLGVRSQGWCLDFSKFRVYLQDKFKVTRAFLFMGYIPSYKKLYGALESAGYELIFKPTIRDHNGSVKGNVDAELVLHTMIEYASYDQAVVVTGDGDFFCLVDYLKSQQKLQRLVVPNRRSCSSLLMSGVFKPYITVLDGTREKLER